MRRSVQVSVGLVLAAALASCGGASVPTAAPATPVLLNPSAAPASTSPVPPLLVSATPAPVASATAAESTPRPSVGPESSTSPDVAALIEAYSEDFSATVRLLDLADSDFAVTVTFVDPTSAETYPLGTYALGSSGQETDSVPPGTYRLDFRQPSGETTGPTCTVTIRKGDAYTFVAVPGAITVSRAGYEPTTAGDLFVPTSVLCQK